MAPRVPYIELHTHSGYSFLDGASHPFPVAATSRLDQPPGLFHLTLLAETPAGYANLSASSSRPRTEQAPRGAPALELDRLLERTDGLILLSGCRRSPLPHYFPTEYYVALFNNRPMAFYSLDALGRDAKRNGLRILPPDANRSGVRCTAEGSDLRVGLRFVRGWGEAIEERVAAEREVRGPFRSLGSPARRG